MAKMVKASHILVKTEEEAKNLKSEIKNAEDFERKAKEVSLCPSSSRGGDLGWFEKGQMVKPFEDAAFSMEKGEISEPVKTQFGYHLLYLADRKD